MLQKITKIANCTLHNQKQFEAEFKLRGFEIVTEPFGFDVAVDDDFNAIDQRCLSIISRLPLSSGIDGILVGGLSSQAYAFAKHALEEGYRVFEVVTERIRENDRFVFNFHGLREIA